MIILLVLALAAGFSQPAWCQSAEDAEALSGLVDDIDALFEAPPASDEDGPGEDVLSRIVDQKTLSFSGNFRATAGYTGGVMQYSGPDAWAGLVSAAAYSMSSTVRLDARVDRTFRFFGALRMAYPELDVRVDELFCDYVFLNTLFLRAGRQRVTWGASQFFRNANLPARLPDGPRGFVADGDRNSDGIDDGDSIALKMTVPFGVSGLTGLVVARNGYFEDSDQPGFRELGYGGLLDLSFAGGEVVLGSFFQRELGTRGYLSGKTTLWGVDLYGEALLTDRLEFAVGGGLVWEALGSRLIVAAEYLYNGETRDLTRMDSDLPIPRGHTAVVRAGLKDFPFAKSRIGAEWKHNFSDGSGTVIPAFSVETFAHLRLSLAVPLVYGPEAGYFVVENPDLRDRRLALALLATLSASF